MKIGLLRILGLTLLFLNCFCQLTESQELIQTPTAIHISSVVSDGKYSIAEIAEIARLNKIRVVILTDRDLMRWEYGLWPLQNIIKKTAESNSIFRYGIRRYLTELRKTQERNPELILIPGTESAPFYYWEGNPLNNSLKMYNWHKHLLVIGLEEPKAYEYLPVIGNRKALYLPFRFKDIYRLWPVLILLAGVLSCLKRKFQYKDIGGRPLGPYSKRYRLCGICLIIIGLLFLLNYFPLCEPKFSQYQGDLGRIPYQNFIDYVSQKGGLVFWVHPEAENIQDLGRVKVETREYTAELLSTEGYAGFGIFHEGYNKMGSPGGIWDELLMRYCLGQRKTPVWVIGALCFDQSGELTSRINLLRTVLLLPQLDKAAVMGALSKGRMYVVKGKQSSQFILEHFTVGDNSTGAYAIMGEELVLEGRPNIEFSGRFLNGQEEEAVEVRVVRDGKIIKAFQVKSPFNISYQDEYAASSRKTYYRLEIKSKGVFLVTNPIFVRRSL